MRHGNGPAAPTSNVPAFDQATQLTPIQELLYRAWMANVGQTGINGQNVNDATMTGGDYDYRGFFKKYGPVNVASGDQHFPDTFKLPNHPTFSIESQYATGPYARYAGMWHGDTFLPSPHQKDKGMASGQLDAVKAQAIAASHLEQAFTNLLRSALTSHLGLKLPDPTSNVAPSAPLPTPPAPQMPVVGGQGGQPTAPVYPPAPPPPPTPHQLLLQQYQPEKTAMQQAMHNAVAGVPGVGFRV